MCVCLRERERQRETERERERERGEGGREGRREGGRESERERERERESFVHTHMTAMYAPRRGCVSARPEESSSALGTSCIVKSNRYVPAQTSVAVLNHGTMVKKRRLYLCQVNSTHIRQSRPNSGLGLSHF